MTTAKYLGIWMDHAHAQLMEYQVEPMISTVILSSFTHQKKAESIGKSENLMHHKEQHQHLSYYKTLADTIRKYESVLLFGPTDAKHELYNLIRSNHHFNSIKIEVKDADKMTDNQQHAFVRDYFEKEIKFQ